MLSSCGRLLSLKSEDLNAYKDNSASPKPGLLSDCLIINAGYLITSVRSFCKLSAPAKRDFYKEPGMDRGTLITYSKP